MLAHHARADASPGAHGHSLALYESDDALVDAVAGFFAPAVRSGEPAILVATPAHRRAIERALAGRGASSGPSPLVVLDAAGTLELFMRDGMPDRALFGSVIGPWIDRAEAGRTGTVRIFGEMVAVLWERGLATAALALEDLWNELAGTRPFDLLCAYPAAPFAGADGRRALEEVRARHSDVIPAPGPGSGDRGGLVTAAEAAPLGLVAGKLRAPSPPDPFVARGRLTERLGAAVAAGRSVVVAAAAGCGKTAAVAHYVAGCGRPVAWLGVDAADRAPGRLVTYLAAALEPLQPGLLEAARTSLAEGVSHEECAGVVAAHLPPDGVVVLDDLHRLDAGGGAPSLLQAFLRQLRPGAVPILISRTMPGAGAIACMLEGVEVVSDAELAFRTDEVGALLAAHGVAGDASLVERETRGWAAGILLHALRARVGLTHPPTAEDPLWAYIDEQIVGPWASPGRRALLASAVLDVVSLRNLGRLIGEEAAAAAFPRIMQARLPASPTPEGIRYSPQVREVLLRRLREEEPGHERALQAAYGEALVGDGLLEEGVDALLASGHRARAEAVVEPVLRELRHRGDAAKILEWSAQLGEAAHRRRPALREAQLRALLALRRHGELERIVRGMILSGELRELTRSAPEVASWAVWALHGSGEWRELLPLLPRQGLSATADVKRFALEVGCAADPPQDPIALSEPRMRPVHVLLQMALLHQGRLDEVERLGRSAREAGRPVVATLAQINVVNVLTMRGELAAARRTLEDVPAASRRSRLADLWLHAQAELAFEEGDVDEALRLVRRARALSRAEEWYVGDMGIFGAAEGRMLVRAGRHGEATGILRAVAAWCGRRGLSAYREWADAWLAAALLRGGCAADAEALRLVREAVPGMSRARRRLELPAAAVVLAEAEWRAGDEAAHDAAAELAYSAATECGTLAPLRRALALFPEVLPRAIDADPGGGERWRLLARARASAGVEAEPAPRLRIRSFGAPVLEAGSRLLPVALAKAVELAAYVAAAGPDGALRQDVIADVFDGSAAASNYLRQALHRLRRALPDGVDITLDGGRLAWTPAAAVRADDVRFEHLVERARTEVGVHQRATLEEALGLVRAGDYLAPVVSDHASRRRRELIALATEARIAYARAARGRGDASLALPEMRRAVREEPYREDAWEERLRVEAAAVGPGAVPSVLDDCRRALAQIGLQPSARIVTLVERLRAG